MLPYVFQLNSCFPNQLPLPPAPSPPFTIVLLLFSIIYSYFIVCYCVNFFFLLIVLSCIFLEFAVALAEFLCQATALTYSRKENP